MLNLKNSQDEINKSTGEFLNLLTSVKSSKELFNQYTGDCPENDIAGNFRIRIDNLKNYLQHFIEQPPAVLLIGESAGYNGAKVSGLHLINTDTASRIGCNAICETNQKMRRSKTEEIIWREMDKYRIIPLTFNIVPFFSKPADSWTKNRLPSKIEVEKYSILSSYLCDIFRPKVVLAMGRSAEYGLTCQKISNIYVRHPSMGGMEQFCEQIGEVLNTNSLRR
jgi:hypothetical protein